MKYIKKFEEQKDEIEFSVGDIVYTSSDNETSEKNPISGRRYKVLSIYDIVFNYYDYVKEKDLHRVFVEVEDVKTGRKYMNWFAYRYTPEWKYESNKYNL